MSYAIIGFGKIGQVLTVTSDADKAFWPAAGINMKKHT